MVREVALPPEEAWERITAWERHGDHVPFTRIRRTTNGFVARTAVGPLGFDDPMEIVEADPPRSLSIAKTGRVVRGDVTILIEPTARGSRVRWTETVDVRGVPRIADGLVAWGGRRLFGRVIDRLLAT